MYIHPCPVQRNVKPSPTMEPPSEPEGSTLCWTAMCEWDATEIRTAADGDCSRLDADLKGIMHNAKDYINTILYCVFNLPSPKVCNGHGCFYG